MINPAFGIVKQGGSLRPANPASRKQQSQRENEDTTSEAEKISASFKRPSLLQMLNPGFGIVRRSADLRRSDRTLSQKAQASEIDLSAASNSTFRPPPQRAPKFEDGPAVVKKNSPWFVRGGGKSKRQETSAVEKWEAAMKGKELKAPEKTPPIEDANAPPLFRDSIWNTEDTTPSDDEDTTPSDDVT